MILEAQIKFAIGGITFRSGSSSRREVWFDTETEMFTGDFSAEVKTLQEAQFYMESFFQGATFELDVKFNREPDIFKYRTSDIELFLIQQNNIKSWRFVDEHLNKLRNPMDYIEESEGLKRLKKLLNGD